jgi:uncharacterized surface protein with fasciclin (FAS1) repeats
MKLLKTLTALSLALFTSAAIAQSNPKVGGAEMSPKKTIAENAANSADHTTLVSAVQAAGLTETLKSEGPYTVFAPTNASFEALPDETVSELLKPENKAKLTAVLTYHVLPGKVDSKAIVAAIKAGKGKAEMKTVQGKTLSFTAEGDKVFVSDGKAKAQVTIADVQQSNGVVHVVNKVLMP